MGDPEGLSSEADADDLARKRAFEEAAEEVLDDHSVLLNRLAQ